MIDVVKVSCAQHAAASLAPLRIQGSAHNYRPANRRSMSMRVNNQTREDTRLCRPKDEATEEKVDHCVTMRSSQAARVNMSSMELNVSVSLVAVITGDENTRHPSAGRCSSICSRSECSVSSHAM